MSTSGLKAFKKQLKKHAEELGPEDLMEWKPIYWSHLIAIAAGLPPWEVPATKVIPPPFRVFLPKDSFKPTSQDRKYAIAALRNALDFINGAIVEVTRQAYQNFSSFGGGQLPVDFESITEALVGDLNQYEKRKAYFQTGMAMMPEEEAWVGKHHIFAVGVINWYEVHPERTLTTDEFLNIARDLAIIDEKDQVTFNPLAPKKPAPDPSGLLADLMNSVGDIKIPGTDQ